MSRPVVVGADGFPDEGHSALAWAAAEARRRRCPLHVVVTRHGARGGTRRAAGTVLTGALTAISAAVPQLPLLGRTVHGRAHDVLRGLSAGAEAVVVPAGAPGVDGVVGSAYCPVFAVPERFGPEDDAPERGPVVLAVAPWTGDEVVGRAFVEASRRRAPLLAVRAAATGDEARWELEMALSAWRIAYPDVPVETAVRPGRVADVLGALSRRARLLVIGRSERGALLSGLVGSPVRDVLGAADCPVLVVPSAGPPHPSLLPAPGHGWALSGG